MNSFPARGQLSEPDKDARIVALGAAVQRLRARLAALETPLPEPVKHAGHASVPPSKTPKAHIPERQPRGRRREASVGRAGDGRPRHPEPDHLIVTKAKRCPPCGHGVQETAHQLPPVYDKIAWPPVKPLVTCVEQYGGQWAHGGQASGAPCPRGEGTRHPLWGLHPESRDLSALPPGEQ